MIKKIFAWLLVVLVVFGLAAGAGYGLAMYRSNNIFIEGQAYPIRSTELDLRDKTLTIEDYENLKAQMPQCAITWMVPFQGSTYSSDSTSLTVTSVTRADLDLIHTYFPDVTELKATGSRDYELLEQFQTERPKCKVIYDVDIGGKTVDPDVTELTLNVGDYDYDTLTANMVHLPKLTAVTLKKPELTLEQLDALKEAYPDTTFQCTVEILGTEYDTETTELDLSALTAGDIEATAQKLGMLRHLGKVELMNAEGESALSKEDVKVLMAACPEVVFNYTFEFFGKTLSTADEEVEYKNVKMGDESEEELRLALDLLTNCKRILLDNCRFSDEVLAKVREDYRDRTKVVWRVWFAGTGTSLTDAEVLRTTYDLDNDNSKDLIYCEDVVYMDIGHDEWLKDITFVSGMPKLEVVIISGSLVADLTPFSNCKNLRILEAAFCEKIEDLTPLKECTKLEMVNISNSHALDLSPLDDLPLTHFVHVLNPSGGSRVPAEEQERFIEKHPDCWSSFKSSQPYGEGWRYDENGDPMPWYKEMARQFRYPNSPNNVGWYMAEPEEE